MDYLRSILEVSLTGLGYRFVLETEGNNMRERKGGVKADISNSSNSLDGILFTEIGNAARGPGGDRGETLQA